MTNTVDCNECANRGKVNGLSEETFCSHCIHYEKWKKSYFVKKGKEMKRPQFSREHGSLYDRGAADSYYRRPKQPHWYLHGTGVGEMIVDLTEEETAEYMLGYNENQSLKNWK